MKTAATYLTPPALARRWVVTPEKVLVFIRNGSLRAFDVSSMESKRTRYRIPISAVIEFEEKREVRKPVQAVRQPVQAVRRRKKQKHDEGFVRYF